MRHARFFDGLKTLHQRLLEGNSATAVMEGWCEERGLARPARIGAFVIPAVCRKLTADQREHLELGPNDPVGYRQVRLVCGGMALCQADNWFVPARLTEDMNRQLATTDTPFGKVVAPLRPYRKTFATMPPPGLPPDWTQRPADELYECAKDQSWPFDPKEDLFEHQALVLRGEDDAPLAEVRETFKTALLADYVLQQS